jgi:hypothetical protein
MFVPEEAASCQILDEKSGIDWLQLNLPCLLVVDAPWIQLQGYSSGLQSKRAHHSPSIGQYCFSDEKFATMGYLGSLRISLARAGNPIVRGEIQPAGGTPRRQEPHARFRRILSAFPVQGVAAGRAAS